MYKYFPNFIYCIYCNFFFIFIHFNYIFRVILYDIIIFHLYALKSLLKNMYSVLFNYCYVMTLNKASWIWIWIWKQRILGTVLLKNTHRLHRANLTKLEGADLLPFFLGNRIRSYQTKYLTSFYPSKAKNQRCTFPTLIRHNDLYCMPYC